MFVVFFNLNIFFKQPLKTLFQPASTWKPLLEENVRKVLEAHGKVIENVSKE